MSGKDKETDSSIIPTVDTTTYITNGYNPAKEGGRTPLVERVLPLKEDR